MLFRSNLPGKSQFLVYEAEDGGIKIDVRLEDETVWLTQRLMADLFQTTKQNIGQHLKNVFSEGELLKDLTNSSKANKLNYLWTSALAGVTGLETFYETIKI